MLLDQHSSWNKRVDRVVNKMSSGFMYDVNCQVCSSGSLVKILGVYNYWGVWVTSHRKSFCNVWLYISVENRKKHRPIQRNFQDFLIRTNYLNREEQVQIHLKIVNNQLFMPIYTYLFFLTWPFCFFKVYSEILAQLLPDLC